jgi:hypothetical protein
MIYLASPYSDKSKRVMEKRYLEACRVVGRLTKKGLVVYSPIVHFHVVAGLCKLPTDQNFWRNIDFEMLGYASKLYILKIPGWKTSKGVLEETQFADVRYIPIVYIR